MNRIPKIIHQTWKTSELSEQYKLLANTWKTFLPDWEYILWTDEMNRDFVAKYYPSFLNKYDSYPQNIQRADAIRYLLLKKYGGLYVDLDFECLDNLEFLFANTDFVAGKEPYWHAERFDMPYIICNAFMASTSNNPFINFLCDKLIEYSTLPANNPIDVLNSTGPFLLTNAYNEFSKKSIIRILEPETIYPIGLYDTDKILSGNISEEMSDRINQAHAIHYFFSTW
ncbi:MAG: glycosyltransferase [Dysgonomonas sp.]|nr:glycosyltransferase [Dysgonomonas sp.]